MLAKFDLQLFTICLVEVVTQHASETISQSSQIHGFVLLPILLRDRLIRLVAVTEKSTGFERIALGLLEMNQSLRNRNLLNADFPLERTFAFINGAKGDFGVVVLRLVWYEDVVQNGCEAPIGVSCRVRAAAKEKKRLATHVPPNLCQMPREIEVPRT